MEGLESPVGAALLIPSGSALLALGRRMHLGTPTWPPQEAVARSGGCHGPRREQRPAGRGPAALPDGANEQGKKRGCAESLRTGLTARRPEASSAR